MSEPLFSATWCARAVQAFNEDPESAAALNGWSGDVALIVRDAGGGGVGVHLREPTHGKLLMPELVSVDGAVALELPYVADASRAHWQALIDGTLDPIAAVVQRKLVLKGNVQSLIERLKFRGLADRWLSAVRKGF